MRPTNPKLIPRPYICVNRGLKSIFRRLVPGLSAVARRPLSLFDGRRGKGGRDI
jgi:hypothetical protein